MAKNISKTDTLKGLFAGAKEYAQEKNIFAEAEFESEKSFVHLDELYEFQGHPFRVLEDDQMNELADSIKHIGLVEPILVRPRKEGGFEIISGHRRKRACELAGLTSAPVIIKELDNDTAAIIMVDSNNKRENLLYSEKAKAYKIKMDAVKHQGSKVSGSVDSAEAVGSELGESARTVQRFIRLTFLTKDLMDLVDQNKLSFMAGVALSYLGEEEQGIIFRYYLNNQIVPNNAQANKIKELYKQGDFDYEVLDKILAKKVQTEKFSNLKPGKLKQYFQEGTSIIEMENVILELLEKWKNEQKGEEGNEC